VKAFTPILWLNNAAEFIWGAEQQVVFEKIKEYLSAVPVLKAPQGGIPFRLYVAAENEVIGAVLTQETERKGAFYYLCEPDNYWMLKQGINLLRNYFFALLCLY
jgi:hypothetical protein